MMDGLWRLAVVGRCMVGLLVVRPGMVSGLMMDSVMWRSGVVVLGCMGATMLGYVMRRRVMRSGVVPTW